MRIHTAGEDRLQARIGLRRWLERHGYDPTGMDMTDPFGWPPAVNDFDHGRWAA